VTPVLVLWHNGCKTVLQICAVARPIGQTATVRQDMIGGPAHAKQRWSFSANAIELSLEFLSKAKS
jgi:hypothetical protein